MITPVPYQPVIGLEVHAQLLTRTKIFCSCSTAFGAPPNTNCCPVCLGLPGALPVLNRSAVEQAMRMILAVGGRVTSESIFARKNYFYPDLPKGYQISQFDLPIGIGGTVEVDADTGARAIRLRRIHLEDDAGKSFHPERADADPVTTIDLNRCGTPLIEIVTEPDLHTAEEAGALVRQLRQIVQYLGVCSGNMEEGALRCDANVSLRPVESSELGTRTEVKNLNSVRSLERALNWEIERQRGLLDGGESVVQETLLWDEKAQRASPMRSKEESSDYRYFPDPDLPPLVMEPEWIASVRTDLPELPRARAHRFVANHAVTAYDSQVLTTTRELADYFEAVVNAGAPSKRAANWIQSEVLRVLKETEGSLDSLGVGPAALAELLATVESGRISGTVAKAVFEKMVATGRSATDIVAAEGLVQISDEDALVRAIDEALVAHPKQLAQYRRGKTKLLGFFVGQVMKALGGKANPAALNRLLRDKLGEPPASGE